MARSTLTFCPLQVEGSFQAHCEAGRQFCPVHPFQTSVHLRHPHCPEIAAPRPNLGPGGPTLCPTMPLTSPVVPPVQGTREGSCVTGCTKTFLNQYSGISVLQGGKWWLPALPRILLQTKHLGIGGQLWCLLVSGCLPNLELTAEPQCKVGTFPWLPLPFRRQEGLSKRGFHISLAKPYPHSKRSG